MRIQTPKTLLAITALALGLAGQAAAQAPRVDRHPQPSRTQKPSSVKVLETDAPAEETPTADSTTAQTQTPSPTMQPTPPSTGSTMAPSAPGAQVREEMGIVAIRDWLALVDTGRFPEAYDQAGEVFRGATARDQWAASLGASRSKYGNVLQRNMKSAVVNQDLPNAPKGKYVVTTFETTFQQQATPVGEIAISYLGADGTWKVVGYQLKPQEAAAAPKPAQ